MLAVIGLHTAPGFSKNDGGWLAIWIYKSCVVAIPLFFMVSGFLLLGRENIGYKYAFRKIFGIVRFVFIVSFSLFCAYVVWNLIQRDYDEDFIGFFLSTFLYSFLQRGHFWMFWYLGAMVLIYLLLPILNKIYQRERLANVFFILLFIGEAVVFALNLYVGEEQGQPFESLFIQTFRLWNWLFYFMLGGIIKRHGSCVRRTHTFYMFLAFSFVLNIVVESWLSPMMHSSFCEYFYCSVVVMLLCCLLFISIQRQNIHDNQLIASLSALFLPVYTFHVFVIFALSKVIDFSMFGIAAPIIMWFTISATTIFISFLLMQIPIMKNIFRI